MLDYSNISAGDLFTVWRKDSGTPGGLAYAPDLLNSEILQVTCQAVPAGHPFIIMLRTDVPQDYDINPDFQPDWDHCDGYGGCN